MDSSRFDSFLNEKFNLVDEESQREAIKNYFLVANLRDGMTLQNAVAGMSRSEATQFIKDEFPDMSRLDASTLAGKLVIPIGNCSSSPSFIFSLFFLLFGLLLH